jgi:cell division protein FtsI/penicillin-binding protein 2
MNYSFFPRIRFFSFWILVLALILVIKLFSLQVLNSNLYKEKANRQYVTPAADIFERGSIYFSDRNGHLVSAAVQITGFKAAVRPAEIADPAEVFNKIKEVLPDLDYQKFEAKVGKKNDPYEEIANRLSQEKADSLSALKIPGLSVYREKWRFYPGENLSSHTLGLVGYQGDELAGRYGLEKRYNAVLARSKNNPYMNFFAEIFSDVNQKLFKEEESNGDIVTSLEPEVQGLLEQKLNEVGKKYQTDSTGGIIMDPKSGAIYALGAKPDFNPNNFSENTNNAIFPNPLVEHVLEFGSVVKPLVMAGALEAGVLTADTTYTDEGFVIVDDGRYKIKNFDNKGRGPNTTMQEVLGQSLNTGMVFVFHQLGKQKMYDYLLSYGIKEKTGIDLPNETGGLVSGLADGLRASREIEFANASFGQGIALTPVAMIRALAVLANEGNLVVPHVAKHIKYDDGTIKEFTYPTSPTKISQRASEEITRMLVTVMDKSLRDGLAKLEHYNVAVKTGTAQVANNETRGYYTDRYTHSFFGYFPAYDPKFIIFLYAVDPKGVLYASQTWADSFLEITKFLINYYQIPPDR